jgi:predicted RNA binding protein YcfA (HicA-like mRNA interferase family)
MRGSELKRRVTNVGWYLVRHESKEVPTGTANHILKQAGTK